MPAGAGIDAAAEAAAGAGAPSNSPTQSQTQSKSQGKNKSQRQSSQPAIPRAAATVLAAAVAAAVFSAEAAATRGYAQVWRNSSALWERAMTVNPADATATSNLAYMINKQRKAKPAAAEGATPAEEARRLAAELAHVRRTAGMYRTAQMLEPTNADFGANYGTNLRDMAKLQADAQALAEVTGVPVVTAQPSGGQDPGDALDAPTGSVDVAGRWEQAAGAFKQAWLADPAQSIDAGTVLYSHGECALAALAARAGAASDTDVDEVAADDIWLRRSAAVAVMGKGARIAHSDATTVSNAGSQLYMHSISPFSRRDAHAKQKTEKAQAGGTAQDEQELYVGAAADAIAASTATESSAIATAIRMLRAAVALQPGHPDAVRNLGALESRQQVLLDGDAAGGREEGAAAETGEGGGEEDDDADAHNAMALLARVMSYLQDNAPPAKATVAHAKKAIRHYAGRTEQLAEALEDKYGQPF